MGGSVDWIRDGPTWSLLPAAFALQVWGMWFWIWLRGSVLRVRGSGFGVLRVGFEVESVKLGVQDLRRRPETLY